VNILKFLPGLAVLLMFATSAVFANNVTVTGAFDGSEPTMGADPVSCDDSAKRFRIAGTITVSTSGIYRIVDAGNWFPFALPRGEIADTVVMVYAENFNSGNPAQNRIASVDEFEDVALTAGTSYVLVVQHWCQQIDGAFAIVIGGGQATVSGDGFTSLPETIATFDANSPTAFFSDLDGVRRYRADAKTVDVSGTYFFVDIGEELDGSPGSLRIYKDSFDPLSTNLNLVYSTEGFFIGSFSLEAGVNYVFVMVENAADSLRLQYVLFPPGSFNFNPGLNGAWVATGIEHQGILMEVFPSSGILFFAQFTFKDQPAVVSESTSRLMSQTDKSGDAKVEALGADDQIWLTAYGNIPSSGNVMNIKYENSTGGRFNSQTPDATIDSNYGTGYIEGLSCNHLVIDWNLPGGIVDTRDYYKAAQDGVPYCESFIPAGPVSSEW